jgi:hypothetical protein
MPFYWLCYHHKNQIFVVIEPAASPIHARMRGALTRFARWGSKTCGRSWLELLMDFPFPVG